DLDTFRARKLIDEGRYIHEMAATFMRPARIAMITAPDDKVISFEGRSRVDIFTFETGKTVPLPNKLWRADAASPYAWLEKLAWSEGGTALAFNAVFDGSPAEIIVTTFPSTKEFTAGPPRSVRLARPADLHVKGYGSPLGWKGQDLLFLGEQRGRVRLYRVAKPEEAPAFAVATPGDVVVETFSSHRDREDLVVVRADPEHLADVVLYTKRPDIGPVAQLTRVNPQADTWKLPQLSVVSWKGAKGDTVEGILELPPDYKKGDKVPLMVVIHGGPT